MTAVPRKKRQPPPINVAMPFTNSINSDLLEGNFTNLHAPPDQHMWKLLEVQKWNKHYDEMQTKVLRQRESIKMNDMKRIAKERQI